MCSEVNKTILDGLWIYRNFSALRWKHTVQLLLRFLGEMLRCSPGWRHAPAQYTDRSVRAQKQKEGITYCSFLMNQCSQNHMFIFSLESDSWILSDEKRHLRENLAARGRRKKGRGQHFWLISLYRLFGINKQCDLIWKICNKRRIKEGTVHTIFQCLYVIWVYEGPIEIHLKLKPLNVTYEWLIILRLVVQWCVWHV